MWKPGWMLCTGVFLLHSLAAVAQVNVDSLERVLHKEHRPLERLEVLRQLSKAYDPAIAEQYATATIHLADSLLKHGFEGDSTVGSQRGNGLWNYGLQFVRRGSPTQAIAWYRQAIAQWEAVHDLEGVVFGNTTMAGIACDEGQPADALVTLNKNLSLHLSWKNVVGMARDHYAIAACYLTMGDHARALDHLLSALSCAARSDVPDLTPYVLANIGLIYNEQGQPDTAIAYYERAITASARSPYPASRVIPVCNLAEILVGRGEHGRALTLVRQALDGLGNGEFATERCSLHRELGVVHRAMGDLDEAVREGEAAVRYNADPGVRSLALVELGFTWLKKGRPHQALATASRLRGLQATATTSILYQRRCAELFYKVFDRIGPADSTLFYYRQLGSLNDSVNSNAIRLKMQSVALQQQELADSLKASDVRHADQLSHQQALAAEQGRKHLFLFIGVGVLLGALGLLWRLRYTQRAKRAIELEKNRSEGLLHNILPVEVADELKAKGEADARLIDKVSILFTDFKGFTSISELFTTRELVDELNACFMAFDHIITARGIEKIKTIGDAYMCAGGLHVPGNSSPVQVVMAALEMRDFMLKRKVDRMAQGLPAFEMRLGIHTGPVVAGIVGVKKFQYDIWGDTVNTASRMESSGEVGRVNISGATYALVKDAVVSSQMPVGSTPLSVVSCQLSERQPDNRQPTTDNQ